MKAPPVLHLLSATTLLITGCASTHSPDALTVINRLDLPAVTPSGSSLSLVRKTGESPETTQPSYQIDIAGYPPLRLPCSHIENRPSLSLESGRGIVIYQRPDGKGLIIDEYVDSAVSEYDPLYITWTSGPPRLQSYAVVEMTPKAREAGRGSRQLFRGWREDGTPEVREVLDD
ncbi:MAG: hypothetical protein JWO82_2415 [Akkermansiaceae bacterium]|nr:hypothetical protein [Akkermansiaceae bacterium]